MKYSVVDVLMSRDGLSEDEANERVKDFKETLNELLEERAGLCEVEDAFTSEFGLEPDYLFEILADLY